MPKTPEKKQVVKEERKSRGFNGLSVSKIKTLQALKSGKSMSRNELVEATGIQKGWSKMLGRKDGEGHEDSLGALGYVKTLVPPEGERGLRYIITASGKQALIKAEKELANSGKG